MEENTAPVRPEISRYMRKLGKKGGHSLWDKLSPEEREEKIKRMVEGRMLQRKTRSKVPVKAP